ncbi:MAG: hypothetical protein AB7H80_12805, partial [Candidatus Kapaibacterium sp.]
ENLRIPFEQELQRDAMLRRSVEAERALMNAFQRDAGLNRAVDAIAIPPALTAKLSTTPGATSLGGGSVFTTIFGTKVGITVISVIGLLGIVVGIFLARPLFRQSKGEGEKNVNQTEQEILPTYQDSASSGVQMLPEAMERIPLPTSSDTAPSSRSRGKTTSSVEEGEKAIEQPEAPEQVSTKTAKENSQQLLDALRQEEKKQTSTPHLKKESTDVKVDIQ